MDLRLLVENRVQESRTLEFKRDLSIKSDADKREFLADVSAFANTIGGEIVFGVDEQQGTASEVVGIEIEDTDAETLRIEQIIRAGLSPRLPQIETQWLPLEDSKFVLVIRIGRSWAAPHRVIYQDYGKFFGRTSAGKYAFDVAELRSAFLNSESLNQNIRRFRTDRIAAIEAGEGALPTTSSPKFVFHLVPLSSFASPHEIQIDRTKFIAPLGHGGGFDMRDTLEGFATFSGLGAGEDRVFSYTLIFREGIIEAVSDLYYFDENTKAIIPGYFEELAIRAFDACPKMLKDYELPLPYFAFFSIVGIRGHRIHVHNRFLRTPNVEMRRDNLLFPEISYDGTVTSSEILAKPTCDLLWNAFGLPQSHNFDASGKFTAR